MSQERVAEPLSQLPTHVALYPCSAAAGRFRSSPEPIRSEDKAVSLAATTSNRLKGMRRRAAKLLARIKADSFDFLAGAPHTTQAGDQDFHADNSWLHRLHQQATSNDVIGEAYWVTATLWFKLSVHLLVCFGCICMQRTHHNPADPVQMHCWSESASQE